ALSRAWAKTGKRIAARIAMIAMTTSSSIRVKARRHPTKRFIKVISIRVCGPPRALWRATGRTGPLSSYCVPIETPSFFISFPFCRIFTPFDCQGRHELLFAGLALEPLHQPGEFGVGAEQQRAPVVMERPLAAAVLLLKARHPEE